MRRVYCKNISKNASIIGYYRSNNLNKVAIAFSNSTLTIWSVIGYPDMVLLQSISGFKGWIQHCVWSQCDKFLVVVSDAFLYLFHRNPNTRNFERLTQFRPHDYPVSGVCWRKTSDWVDPAVVESEYLKHNKSPYTVITCSYDGTIRVWKVQDIIDGKYSELVDKNDRDKPLDKGRWDASVMAYGYESAKCSSVWGVKQDMTVPSEVNPKVGHSGKVTAVDCDPVGERVISGGVDTNLLLWSISEGVVIKIYSRKEYHKAPIMSVKWSYERDIFASCASDASVYLWSTKYDIPLLNCAAHHHAVDNLLFINSHKLLTSGRDSFIGVWDIRDGGVVDSTGQHGRSAVVKHPMHKVKPKMTGWINAMSCTPEGLDIVIITAFMKESLYLFSPKYTDPEWLALPFYKKCINYFTRHMAKKAPVKKLSKEQQLIKNYDSVKDKKRLTSAGKVKLVEEPTWNDVIEKQQKRQFIRVESWSWNQHLIDYGDSLSKQKVAQKRRGSVLQTLRRKISLRQNSMDYESVSRRTVEENSGRLLGRGYSNAELPEAANAQKLSRAISAVWDPLNTDNAGDDDAGLFSGRMSVDDSGRENSSSRRRSVWALMDEMDEIDPGDYKGSSASAGKSKAKKKSSRIFALEEEDEEDEEDVKLESVSYGEGSKGADDNEENDNGNEDNGKGD